MSHSYIEMIYSKTFQEVFAINDELEGFFPSSRDIRQGCSLFPFLFVMVQNVLSCLLNCTATTAKISRHPWRDHVHVTHLTFVDDIIVFTDGFRTSLRDTICVFKEFARISGLHINANKSAMFVGGRNKQALIEAVVVHGIPTDSLLVRYLGLPLTTK